MNENLTGSTIGRTLVRTGVRPPVRLIHLSNERGESPEIARL